MHWIRRGWLGEWVEWCALLRNMSGNSALSLSLCDATHEGSVTIKIQRGADSASSSSAAAAEPTPPPHPPATNGGFSKHIAKPPPGKKSRAEKKKPAKLPVGWTFVEEGEEEGAWKYSHYLHKDTNERSMYPPTKETPAGWSLLTDEEGTEFFYDEETGESAWKTS